MHKSFCTQDILSEIQRLKEEARRYLSLLSQEEDGEHNDDQLSPSKKQSLTREVESLQVNRECFYSPFNYICKHFIPDSNNTKIKCFELVACCGNENERTTPTSGGKGNSFATIRRT